MLSCTDAGGHLGGSLIQVSTSCFRHQPFFTCPSIGQVPQSHERERRQKCWAASGLVPSSFTNEGLFPSSHFHKQWHIYMHPHQNPFVSSLTSEVSIRRGSKPSTWKFGQRPGGKSPHPYLWWSWGFRPCSQHWLYRRGHVSCFPFTKVHPGVLWPSLRNPWKRRVGPSRGNRNLPGLCTSSSVVCSVFMLPEPLCYLTF